MRLICIPWPTPLIKYSKLSSTMLLFIFFLIVTTAFTFITWLSLLPPRGTDPLVSNLLSNGDVVILLLSPLLITAWICTLRRHPDEREMFLRWLLSAISVGDRRSEANILAMRCAVSPTEKESSVVQCIYLSSFISHYCVSRIGINGEDPNHFITSFSCR